MNPVWGLVCHLYGERSPGGNKSDNHYNKYGGSITGINETEIELASIAAFFDIEKTLKQFAATTSWASGFNACQKR